jgi:hypothetical protein
MTPARRSSAPPTSTLRVVVRCTDLPGRTFHDTGTAGAPRREPVYLGLQRGREVVAQVRADRPTATFEAEFRVARKRDGTPNFLGPCAQGTAADRFFYLSWGVRTTGGGFAMFRRLKVGLGHLTWGDVERAVRRGRPLEVRLRLTDAKGGPLCATPPATQIRWRLR